MINQSPRVETQLKLAGEMQAGGAYLRRIADLSISRDTPVLQARWVPGGGPYLRWDIPTDGYTWWFNQDTRDMAYTPAKESDLTAEEALGLRWRPHKAWQMEALERIGDPDDQPQAPIPAYTAMVAKGKQRWEELEKHMHSGGGQLDATTQAARDWFFQEYYTTPPGSGESTTDVKSNYNARPRSWDRFKAKGEYTGTLNLGEGHMRLDQTFALGGPGEMYYNPRTGNAEQKAIREQRAPLARKPELRFKEEAVAGDGQSMVQAILLNNPGLPAEERFRMSDRRFTPVRFRPGEDPFFAMLAVPNVTAAIFLIRDHGQKLGIGTITQITIGENKGHIKIYFGKGLEK
jgi:hypothetical protein